MAKEKIEGPELGSEHPDYRHSCGAAPVHLRLGKRSKPGWWCRGCSRWVTRAVEEHER